MLLFDSLIDMLQNLSILDVLLFFLDAYFVWLAVYLLLNLIKVNARTLQILKGLIFIYIISFFSELLSLPALNAMVDMVIFHGVLAVLIIFQPEIRAALERIGLNSAKRNAQTKKDDLVDTLSGSVDFLSKRRIGALVVIEQEIKLDEFLSSSTIMDSQISMELLNTIFAPTTPLHDGAVIIRDEKIYSAATYLPLTNRTDVSKEFGTRHRAAIGVSEITDAVVLVVSEESGSISIARSGYITKFETIEKFKVALQSQLK